MNLEKVVTYLLDWIESEHTGIRDEVKESLIQEYPELKEIIEKC